ncbi:hypothetical protein COCCADRAFT_103164, partial [Bipolaris zeicola 26-R-13]
HYPAKTKRRPSAPNGRRPSPLAGANSCTSLPPKLTETWHSRLLPVCVGGPIQLIHSTNVPTYT